MAVGLDVSSRLASRWPYLIAVASAVVTPAVLYILRAAAPRAVWTPAITASVAAWAIVVLVVVAFYVGNRIRPQLAAGGLIGIGLAHVLMVLPFTPLVEGWEWNAYELVDFAGGAVVLVAGILAAPWRTGTAGGDATPRDAAIGALLLGVAAAVVAAVGHFLWVDPFFLDLASRYPETWSTQFLLMTFGWPVVVAMLAVLHFANVVPRQIAAGALSGTGVIHIVYSLLPLLDPIGEQPQGLAFIYVPLAAGVLALIAGLVGAQTTPEVALPRNGGPVSSVPSPTPRG
jgi:hypothetical protein